ncbi:MAG: thiol:disulfide interchange protein DsbA/DsbL [Wenzhouxiangellaceae bacterium]|nr:thiol:disulfide interchange protein DsbA/DsbL [Wenzhouxiangellaceae bacterium]
MKNPSRTLAAGLLTMLVLLLAAPLSAQNWQEGEHFERIEGPDLPSDGTVEVVEVFSYMCPHCGNFQPYVGPWHDQLPENVAFSRAPVSFNPSWETFARAYYTAEVLDILDQSHEALFKALHVDREPIRNLEDLAEFHSEFGVEAATFKSTAASFPVESKLRMGNALIGKWRVRSTPTLVINGKYRVSPWRGGTFEDMLAVADYLIARELGTASTSTATAQSAGH